ncbi:MAG TPA: LysM peptidoglycan-binding domain-containing protein [Dongiaceae bacterium]|nr:LysM peptidoglycan-binding domain-containing protein [Dongiaceae bacterium]
MSMPNPFLPAGSLMAERQRRNRAHFKLAVYVVLTAHAMLVLGLLIEGCKSDDPALGRPPAAGSIPPTAGGDLTLTAPARVAGPGAIAPADKGDLRLPAGAAGPGAIAPRGRGDLIYVVKSGDTVPHIAKAHGTTAQALRTANSLKNDRLVVGMKLKVPPSPG